MKKQLLTAATTLLFSVAAFAASPVGTWQTIDDETGKPSGEIEIYMNGNTLEGKVAKIIKEAPSSFCKKCPGDKKDKPVLGMVVMYGLKEKSGSNGSKWVKGKILDPEKGKVYKSKLTLAEDNKTLEVRGYIGISLVGRSQTWHRIK